jgi:hypothetical protein
VAEAIDPRLRDHYCFGCGRHNPIGLHLVFDADGEGVATRYIPRPEDQGFPAVMHGGLLALLLDEAMFWAMYGDGIFAVHREDGHAIPTPGGHERAADGTRQRSTAARASHRGAGDGER